MASIAFNNVGNTPNMHTNEWGDASIFKFEINSRIDIFIKFVINQI